MNSSTDIAIANPGVARPAPRPELRTGLWTRLGDDSILGDTATEESLDLLAERARSAARAQGYTVGWAQGRRAAASEAEAAARVADELVRTAEQRREGEHQAAIDALVRAAAGLHEAVSAICDSVAEQATDLALAVTHELLGHELSVLADPGVQVVRRALAAAPPGPTVSVRLHPALVETGAVSDLAALGVAVIGDPSLAPADAIIESDETVIDLRMSTALERLTDVLAPDRTEELR